ncbi:hypothetical protein P3X46_003172 [Hevea brasiliensis]|uniref:Pentatricopeptide repeat-containing protein n=1 Tax=Hevea brasiliensis TaxID=3981 RepID=A0ABQ9N955_HEVBR|nr:hypothetical protein P3X46_003172 [Hevea brasiliensis]
MSRVFTRNTLIRAFSHSQASYIPYFSHSQAPYIPFSIYSHMHNNSILPNNHTFPSLLKSLSDFKDFKQSQCVHTHVIKFVYLIFYVQNSLLYVYTSCGHMRLCLWTVLIMGHGNAGNYDDALIAVEQMQYAGFGAIEMGIWIHYLVRRNRWESDVILGTSLIYMCMKCGRTDEGFNLLRSMKEKNTFAWNAVNHIFAKCWPEAVLWHGRMKQDPNEVNLVNMLSACIY